MLLPGDPLVDALDVALDVLHRRRRVGTLLAPDLRSGLGLCTDTLDLVVVALDALEELEVFVVVGHVDGEEGLA